METPGTVACAFIGCWQSDIDRAMAMVASDIVYSLNVANTALPIGGEVRGWDAVYAVMRQNREIFDYLVYKPQLVGVEGLVARMRIELMLRHRASDELLNLTMRTMVRVEDGIIARVDEYVDAPMVEAFVAFFEKISKP